MATFGTKLQGAAEASNLRQMAGDMGALSRMAPAQNRAVGGMDDGHYARNAKVEAEAPRVFSRWQMDLRHQDQMRQMQDEQNLQNWARLGIENRKFGHTKNMDTARLGLDKDRFGHTRQMDTARLGLDRQRIQNAAGKGDFYPRTPTAPIGNTPQQQSVLPQDIPTDNTMPDNASQQTSGTLDKITGNAAVKLKRMQDKLRQSVEQGDARKKKYWERSIAQLKSRNAPDIAKPSALSKMGAGKQGSTQYKAGDVVESRLGQDMSGNKGVWELVAAPSGTDGGMAGQWRFTAGKTQGPGRKISDFKDADAAFISKTLSDSGYDMSDIDPAALAGAARSVIANNPRITPQQLAAETARLVGATNMTNPDALLGVLNKGDVDPQKRERVLRALSGLGNGAVDENMTTMNINKRMSQLEPIVKNRRWFSNDPDWSDDAKNELSALQGLQSRNREKMKQMMLPEVKWLVGLLNSKDPEKSAAARSDLQSFIADGTFTEDELGAIINPSRNTGAYEGMGAGTAVPWIQ